jgi:hypothetical protein
MAPPMSPKARIYNFSCVVWPAHRVLHYGCQLEITTLTQMSALRCQQSPSLGSRRLISSAASAAGPNPAPPRTR